MKFSVWFNVKLLCLVVFTHLNDFIFAFAVFFFSEPSRRPDSGKVYKSAKSENSDL